MGVDRNAVVVGPDFTGMERRLPGAAGGRQHKSAEHKEPYGQAANSAMSVGFHRIADWGRPLNSLLGRRAADIFGRI